MSIHFSSHPYWHLLLQCFLHLLFYRKSTTQKIYCSCYFGAVWSALLWRAFFVLARNLWIFQNWYLRRTIQITNNIGRNVGKQFEYNRIQFCGRLQTWSSSSCYFHTQHQFITIFSTLFHKILWYNELMTSPLKKWTLSSITSF